MEIVVERMDAFSRTFFRTWTYEQVKRKQARNRTFCIQPFRPTVASQRFRSAPAEMCSECFCCIRDFLKNYAANAFISPFQHTNNAH
jgi:hypothetical protein